MVSTLVKRLRFLAMIPVIALLGGCNSVIMNPAGDMALRERNLIIASTGLMLLIILPVMAATIFFAWRYRASNTSAAYDPDWHHSTQLEVLIWTAPLLIIIALGALTWISTHVLDPFRTVDRIDAHRPLPAGVKPLTVDVVALDWKWLFFYPEQGIATVNDLALPLDRPINFHITSATVMNSFFIPALSGQVYAMAGMETRLSVVGNKLGDYNGLSSQYSGAGFSHMNFATHVVKPADFDEWVAKAKGTGTPLQLAAYNQLQKPSESVPPTLFSSYEPKLFDRILNMCAEPNKMCMDEMMMIDEMGGGGKESEANRARLISDPTRAKEGNEAPGATFPASGRPPNSNVQPQGMMPRPLSPEVNSKAARPDGGQGHLMPGMEQNSPAPAQLHQN